MVGLRLGTLAGIIKIHASGQSPALFHFSNSPNHAARIHIAGQRNALLQGFKGPGASYFQRDNLSRPGAAWHAGLRIHDLCGRPSGEIRFGSARGDAEFPWAQAIHYFGAVERSKSRAHGCRCGDEREPGVSGRKTGRCAFAKVGSVHERANRGRDANCGCAGRWRYFRRKSYNSGCKHNP